MRHKVFNLTADLSKPVGVLLLTLFFAGFTSPCHAAFWNGSYFKKMTDRAAELAQGPFEDLSRQPIPEQIANMGYDQWRGLRFRPKRALGKKTNSSFQVQLFHLGFLYKWPVRISVIDHQEITPVMFSKDLFDYGLTGLKDVVPEQFFFSGFRVHYPINRPDYWDEVIAFLGASYFRGVAQGQVYGISSRGLAVNTGSSSGEEFPYFREFWIEQSSPKSKKIVIYALLDSPSVTGAFQFTLKPGPETVMEVRNVLFARRDIDKLGLAPLTSMYFFGENQRAVNHNDFRPEVHDSDGLLIHSQNDEWIWRPLINPGRLLINSFDGENVEGFGLLQRDTNFDHYQDLEARSDIRPSAWVEPKGKWGKGHVELLQIPTTNEYNDNMNAFWVPEQPFKAGQRLEFQYTLRWFGPTLKKSPLGYVTDTRMFWEKENEIILFIVEYTGDKLNALPEDVEINPEIDVTGGFSLIQKQMIKNKITGGWRLVFRLQRGQRDPFKDMIPSQKPAVDLRVILKKGKQTLTETWIYSFLP